MREPLAAALVGFAPVDIPAPHWRVLVFQPAQQALAPIDALRRRPDIGRLAAGFLASFGEELGKGRLTLTAETVPVLEGYDWPGNVRELRNLMERAAVLCQGPDIDAPLVRMMLPRLEPPDGDRADEPLRLEPAVEELERKLILRALGVAHDNKAEAARLLGVSERTLWYKLKRHGL